MSKSQSKAPPGEWVNITDHAITLASGQPLDAYGGRGHSDMSDPHDQALRDSGQIIPAEKEQS